MATDRAGLGQRRPVIGVLITRASMIRLRRQNPPRRILDLERANRRTKNTLFYFNKKAVDYDTLMIKGMYYDCERRRWRRKLFPLPDVLYKRVCASRRLLRLMERHHVAAVNLRAFDKWNVYKALRVFGEIRPYLPATVLCTDVHSITDMLAEHGTVYLKACRGRRGRQVMRVRVAPGGGYDYSHYDPQTKGACTHHVHDCNELMRLGVEPFFAKKRFLVQQGIDVLTVDGRNVDLRVEAGRNGEGNLEVIAVMARIGRSCSPITTHASCYSWAEFCRQWTTYSPKEAVAIQREIEEFVHLVYQRIEESFLPYGELGVDLALDKQGKLWFLECNSQSAKVSLCKAAEPQMRRRSFENVLAYARFLYGQKNMSIERG